MQEALIAIDDDEDRAVSQVKAVGNLLDDQFKAHVLHVFQENIEGASMANFATVRPVKDHLEAVGVEYRLHGRSGDVASQVVAVAEELNIDVLTISGRKRSPTGKVLFGSVAQDVILSTNRPVLVCGADGDAE
jgi:nucleotide-binding universal stress UspA family protein